MSEENRFYELQKKFESILGDHRMSDREVLTRLLQAAQIYAMDTAQELSKDLIASISRPIIVCTDQETADRLLEQLKKKEG
jgi:arginine repressor